MMNRTVLVIGGLAALMLPACGGNNNFYGAHYWQRASVADAAFKRGPSEQTELNRDIAHCVASVRESEKLAVIRNAIPLDERGRALDGDEKTLAAWDTPVHDGALLAEHSDYPDFETCMKHAGWERVESVRFPVAQQSRENYYRAHVKYGYDPAVYYGSKETRTDDFSNLNK